MGHSNGGPRKLDDKQSRFVIIRLAEGAGPVRVLRELKERWPNVDITKQGIQGYDPTTHQGRTLNKKYRTLFETRRRAFLQAVADEPYAHQRVRLQKWAQQVDELDDQVEAARSMGAKGNPRLVAELIKLQSEIIERIAKEVGDVFTNRRKHEGRAVDVLAQVLGIAPDELEAAD